jgi:hypothetical protein
VPQQGGVWLTSAACIAAHWDNMALTPAPVPAGTRNRNTVGATVCSFSCGGITDRSANPTHLGAKGTSVFGMGALAMVHCSSVPSATATEWRRLCRCCVLLFPLQIFMLSLAITLSVGERKPSDVFAVRQDCAAQSCVCALQRPSFQRCCCVKCFLVAPIAQPPTPSIGRAQRVKVLGLNPNPKPLPWCCLSQTLSAPSRSCVLPLFVCSWCLLRLLWAQSS